MVLNNRKAGIAGITVGVLLCMLCGLPVIAAMLGISGLSVAAMLSSIPAVFKIIIGISGLLIIALLLAVMVKKMSKVPTESGE